MNNVENKVHPGFLKVRGRFQNEEERAAYIKKLAGALHACLFNHGYAELRCIGEAAVYNATKAIVSVNGSLAQQGTEIYFSVAYDTGNIGELPRGDKFVQDVTAIKFFVKDFTQQKLRDFVKESSEDK